MPGNAAFADFSLRKCDSRGDLEGFEEGSEIAEVF